jgi:hypothetical protein
MPGVIQSPRIRQQPYTGLSAQSVPTDIEMSSTGGRPGGPQLSDNRRKWLGTAEPRSSRPKPARLLMGVVGIYVLYRLVT